MVKRYKLPVTSSLVLCDDMEAWDGGGEGGSQGRGYINNYG